MADPRRAGGPLEDGEPGGQDVTSARGEALVLAAHGSHADARSSRPTIDHADRLRDRGRFAEVRTAFWKGEPSLRAVLATVGSDAATVVPMMTSEGYFVGEVFPRELRLDADPPHAPATVRYADPVGTHPAVTDVVERRATAAAADPAAAAVAVVGHGTDRNATSGVSARTHADRLRRRGRFAEVGALYLDEEPGVGRLPERFDAAECVVVPLFVADAGHVTEDVPAAVEGVGDGASGSGATTDDGRRVRYAGALGTAPSMADVAVARAVEAGADVGVEALDVDAGGAEVDAGGAEVDAGGADVDAGGAVDVGGDGPANRPVTAPARRPLLRWLERADDLPASARHALLRSDAGLSRTWGELLVTVAATPAGDRRYEVRHVADAGTDRGSLTRLAGPRALRDRARFDADGRYRPLPSARSLPDGWVLPHLDGRGVAAALDHVYPASVADWARERAGRLPVTHFRETAARQTGRYEPLADLSAAALGAAVEACCSGCVRERRWAVADGVPVPGCGRDDGTAGEADGTTIETDGTVIEADGTVIEADGTADEADGTAGEADGTTIETDGTTIETDGTAGETDGTVIEADGTVIEADDAAMEADDDAIPCPEACPVLRAAAREVALLERGADPDGELGRFGGRLRARYRRARRDREGARGQRDERTAGGASGEGRA